jgi:hypothetical protein
MTHAIINCRKFSLEARVSLLALAVVVISVGRRGAISVFAEFIHIGETVTELPCRIATGFRNLSLDRLDPTCPQCI